MEQLLRWNKTMDDPNYVPRQCSSCADGLSLPFEFSMAFQPIIDVDRGRVYAYEALVRGVKNEPASHVLGRVTAGNRYAFDQGCRIKAITLAVQLGLPATGAKLSINFMPGAVYSPAACIRLTLHAARKVLFPLDKLIFEITEAEEVVDRAHLIEIVDEYRRHNFQIAVDDFGAGHSGFNLLADVTPNILKLDMALIRNIHLRSTATAIVHSVSELCDKLGILLIAEGVETLEELRVLRECRINLMQGYLFARPAFESLPSYINPYSTVDGCQPHSHPKIASTVGQCEIDTPQMRPEPGLLQIL